MSENDSIFGSVIYRAIGEPEYWQNNSVEALVKLLTEEYHLDDPDSIAQVKMGKELVGKLSEKDAIGSAVMTVLDDARYGLLLVNHEHTAIYHNRTLNKYLKYLVDESNQTSVSTQLRLLIENHIDKLNGVANSELTRLDYNTDGQANVYIRSVLQSQVGESTPKYLHRIMLASSNDDSSHIYKEISRAYGLSEREVSIVQSAVRTLSTGGGTKEIAEDVFISLNTVKTHLKSIYTKCGINSLASLVSLYLQHEIQQLASYFGGADETRDEVNHSEDKTQVLSNGQLICYREYGDPQGEPLIVLHNSYSSRLNIPPDGDLIAKQAGRRIIIPDRPGYGKSPANDLYPLHWSQQLAEFAETIKLETFELLGSSLSVRFAIDFANEYPEKLSKLILVAPLLLTSKTDKKYFCDWLKVASELFERSPEFATEIYKLWCASASLRLEEYIQKKLATSISSAEKGVLDTGDFISVINDNFRESIAQQCSGTLSDFRYCFNNTKLDINHISTATEVWIGGEDRICNPEGVKADLAGLTNKTFIIKQGYGEHIYYSQFEEIISLRR